MSHRVTVDLIGDQEILVDGELVNIHDIKWAIVNGKGRIVGVIKHEPSGLVAKLERCPDKKGYLPLPLTESEKEEFKALFPQYAFSGVVIEVNESRGEIWSWVTRNQGNMITNYHALLWLHEKFNLRRKK